MQIVAQRRKNLCVSGNSISTMRMLLLTILFFGTISFYSCSLYFDAFIRNNTSETATIDVFPVKTNQWRTLPNRVTTANTILISNLDTKNF